MNCAAELLCVGAEVDACRIREAVSVNQVLDFGRKVHEREDSALWKRLGCLCRLLALLPHVSDWKTLALWPCAL